MGCCCSSNKVYVVNNNVPGQGKECLELLQKLLFTDSDINIMYNAFCEFDLTGDGIVSLVEFLTILQIGLNYSLELLFLLFLLLLFLLLSNFFSLFLFFF